MQTEVRPIRSDDIASFYDLLSIVIAERRYLAFVEPPPFEGTLAFCRRNIEKGYPQRVALDGKTVIGWCDITPAGRDSSKHVGVLGMGLAPHWRGRGLGERLMRETLADGWAFGFTRIELGVYAHNARARALYCKVGFVEEGVRRGRVILDTEPIDEIMMAIFKS